MLKELHINKFAIIDELELEFNAGMSALTGETGAGKSILLGALGLVLGDRADSDSLRGGAARAEISANFDIHSHPQAQAWLSEQALDSDNECILRRVINRESPSKAFINSSPVTLQSMRELAEMLVTIHGQHEHQALLKRDIQRQRLDDYGGNQALTKHVADAYTGWRTIHDRFLQLQNAEKNRSERLEHLRFLTKEFEQLDLQKDEWQALQEEHQRLANSSQLLQTATQALSVLYNDDLSLHSSLSQQQQYITEISRLDVKLKNTAETLNSALIQIDEAADQLRGYLSDLNLDPTRLELLEDRIGAIHTLSRKHRCDPEQLLEISSNLAAELNDLEHADERLNSLADETVALRSSYLKTCKTLSTQRQQAAETLSARVSEAMNTLGMAGGQFKIELSPRIINPETGEGFSATGLDQIEFLVTTNPGQSLRSLAKVASGGELSRISLAIQMITASNETIPTLIFDEVDAGVGGHTAEVVGIHLRELGEQCQVLCVTHLPQVASQAHNHYQITKQTKANATTRTVVKQLSIEERISEIARMLGGVEITETTRKHAEEMIHRGSKDRPLEPA